MTVIVILFDLLFTLSYAWVTIRSMFRALSGLMFDWFVFGGLLFDCVVVLQLLYLWLIVCCLLSFSWLFYIAILFCLLFVLNLIVAFGGIDTLMC